MNYGERWKIMLLEYLILFPLRNEDNQHICFLYIFKHSPNTEISTYWCFPLHPFGSICYLNEIKHRQDIIVEHSY